MEMERRENLIKGTQRTIMYRRGRLITLLACILALVAYISSVTVLPAPVASAHAFVIGSDPIDSSTVNTVPGVVRITFNSAISPLSSVRIYFIQNGERIDVTDVSSYRLSADQRQVEVGIQSSSSQPQGSYEVRWRAVSTTDGHTTYGLIGFNVGVSSTGISGVPTLGPGTSNNLYGPGGVRTFDIVKALGVSWDWLSLLALTFWIGILITERLILPGTERTRTLLERARKQTHSLQVLCLLTLLFAESVTLLLRATQIAQGNGLNATLLFQLLTQTNYGYFWLTRVILIAIALLLLRRRSHPETGTLPSSSTQRGPRPFTTRPQPSGGLNKHAVKEPAEQRQGANPSLFVHSQTPIWLLLGGLILLTRALSGDAAQVLQPHFSALVFDWLRYIAQGIWFGGLAYSGYILLPILSTLDRDHNAETLMDLQRRFLPFHLTGMGILLFSNLFLSEASISNVEQLVTDPYGRTLLVQIILLIVLFAMSLYTLLALFPTLTRQALLLPVVGTDLPARRTRQFALENSGRRLKLTISMQSWLGAGILFCSALMAFYAPPIVFPDVKYTDPHTETTAQTSTQTRQVGDLSVTLQLLPAKVAHENVVTLTLTDRNGLLITNARIRLHTNMTLMDMGMSAKTIQGGNPTYTATFDNNTFSMEGVWYIDVLIERPQQPTQETRFLLTLTR
jgi:methionine-rich copper-binding protein CopC/putative copper export protein